MIDNLVTTARAEYRRLITTMIGAMVVAAAAMVAMLFAAVALFVWMSNNYGTVPAALAMAGLFAAIALAAWGVMAALESAAREKVAQRAAEQKREREETAKHAPPTWLDPALLPTLLPIGIQAARIALKHRGLLLALVSSAAVGWAMLREKNAPPEDAPVEQPAE